MTDYSANPAPLRTLPSGEIVYQCGDQATVGDSPAEMVTAREILDNPRHYLRAPLASILGKMQSGEISAIVLASINGKPAQIILTAAQFALGAGERARHAAWLAGCAAARKAARQAERDFDAAENEGGEGYNPHRIPARSRKDRDYPDHA